MPPLTPPLTRPASPPTRRHAVVVGAGWAGLAAAVRLVQLGLRVTVLEMAPRPGGRARSLAHDDVAGGTLDNGQHILIGAYTDTLSLMRSVGADPDKLLMRLPLVLRQPGLAGLRLRPGLALPAFVRGVLACTDWTGRERLALLHAAARWGLSRFRSPPGMTVAQLCAGLPERVRSELIDPLCVAALNTPASDASAQVLLRVLRDALFGGPGAADLLLPRAPLHALLPGPAMAWLRAQGAALHFGHRVAHLARRGSGWAVDGIESDLVVLAASAAESARLGGTASPGPAAIAARFAYEPIATVYMDAPGATLEEPMLALASDDRHPAQFVFDLGQLQGGPGRLAFVISGAAPWVARGRDAIGAATLEQARGVWPDATWRRQLSVRQVLVDKRATFRCTPGLVRPPSHWAPGLWVAGDFVDGPYPATLEGAVRSGLQAAAGALAEALNKMPLCSPDFRDAK